MKCSDIGFGTYDCAYNIMLPYLVHDPCEPDAPPQPKTVCIDKCLLPEVVSLWEKDIRTAGCCCGHAKQPPFIAVMDSEIPKMKALGYKVSFNDCRPGDEDSFIPKTKIVYGDADKGFNWWDGQST